MCSLLRPLGVFTSLRNTYNLCWPDVADNWQPPNKSPKWCAFIPQHVWWWLIPLLGKRPQNQLRDKDKKVIGLKNVYQPQALLSEVLKMMLKSVSPSTCRSLFKIQWDLGDPKLKWLKLYPVHLESVGNLQRAQVPTSYKLSVVLL